MRFLFFLLLIGCASSKYVYWQSNFKPISKNSDSYVIKVEVPEYMLAGNFVKVEGDRMVILDKKINSTAQTFFAKYSALALNQLLSSKNILYYPLSTKGKIIDIKIVDFYKYNNEAILRIYYKKMLEFRAKSFKEAYDKFLIYLAKRIGNVKR